MNIITMAAFGAAVLAFGPGFLVQAGIGYVAGTACGCYAENRMKRLHHEICRRTGDKTSDMDNLGEWTAKASQIGGVFCPIVPLITAGVGLYCSHKANKLRESRTRRERSCTTADTARRRNGVGARF